MDLKSQNLKSFKKRKNSVLVKCQFEKGHYTGQFEKEHPDKGHF